MFVQVPLTGPSGVVRVEVSVPYVAAHDADDTEKRRYRAREPTLRSLVRLELASDSAEQMGKQLKRRFDRSYQRRGDNAAWRRANR